MNENQQLMSQRTMLGNKIVLPTDPMSTPFQAQLDSLARTAHTHPALNNLFYQVWRSRQLNLNDFQIFAVNYFTRVQATTTRLSLALAVTQDWESRIELLHNLSDELGHGEAANVHALVVFRWLSSLNKALGSPEDFRTILNGSSPLSTTMRFVNETNDLCRQGPRQAAGALLAQEWNGYTQIAYLSDGFLQYRHLYKFQDFHDVSEYFYVHLGRAEKEHQIQASRIAARHCHDEIDFNVLKGSFDAYMGLLNIFWQGITEQFSTDCEYHAAGTERIAHLVSC